MSSISTLRKRRGVARASITRLTTRLKDLESDTSRQATLGLAQGMTRKLDALDSDFRTHHHALIDLIDDEEALQEEQSTLDEHDDVVAELAVRIQQLINLCTSFSEDSPRKLASRRLIHLQKSMSPISAAVAALSGEPDDTCLLQQYEEQLSDCKRELADLRSGLLSLDLDETDELSVLQGGLEKELFDWSLRIKQLLQAASHP